LKHGNAIGEALQMLESLNDKADLTKVNPDMNDDDLKAQVYAEIKDMMEKLTVLSQARHTAWSELEM